MKKSDALWEKIYNNTNAPRQLLVEYVKELASEAKQLPIDEREARGDYADSSKKFPQTRGEEIANAINYALSMQDWIDYETADDLEEVGEIAGNLEISPDKHKLWQELFAKVDELQDHNYTQ